MGSFCFLWEFNGYFGTMQVFMEFLTGVVKHFLILWFFSFHIVIYCFFVLFSFAVSTETCFENFVHIKWLLSLNRISYIRCNALLMPGWLGDMMQIENEIR